MSYEAEIDEMIDDFDYKKLIRALEPKKLIKSNSILEKF